MKMIITCEDITLNCDIIAMLYSVFIDTTNGNVSDTLNDEVDPDNIAFGIAVLTTLGDEVILEVFESEEERDFKRYKIESWLSNDYINLM